jgi:hypothetical protein
MTDETTNADTTPEVKAPRAPKVHWTDAQKLRLQSGMDPDSAAYVLLSVLVISNTPRAAVDTAIGAPEGTTLDYLRTRQPQVFDGGVLDDARADTIVHHLARLKIAGALGPRGLRLEGVLAAMMDGNG